MEAGDRLMQAATTAGSPWPARLAYSAALIFTLASAGTNLIYGIAKGTDTASSVVWAAVSLAVSIVFALSWPALIRAIERRQWALLPMAFTALLLTGAYSVTAALGSASGGRANATIQEQSITDQRAKAQAAYDVATSELANIKPARPIAELEPLIAASTSQWRKGCRVHVANGIRQTTCPPNPTLIAELGRARRRAELELKIESASTKLESAKLTKQANSDAVALAGYLAAIGVTATAEMANKWLVILAVLSIEMDAGLTGESRG
jgi:hypothetical protein